MGGGAIETESEMDPKASKTTGRIQSAPSLDDTAMRRRGVTLERFFTTAVWNLSETISVRRAIVSPTISGHAFASRTIAK